MSVSRLLRTVAVAVVVAASAAPAAPVAAVAGPPPVLPHVYPPQVPRPGTAPRTAVDPRALPRDAAPSVPYYDRRTSTIEDGARSVALRGLARVVQLARVRAGYVALSERGDAGYALQLVTRAGRQTVLVRAPYVGLGPVAPGRRRVLVYTGTNSRTDISLVRVHDGRVLASRTFRNGDTAVVAVGRHRALVSNGDRTFWWTYGREALRAFSRDPLDRADLTHHLFVGDWNATDRGYLVSSAPGGPAWSWKRHQPVGQISPDGRHVLTLTEAFNKYGGVFARIRVRDTRTGTVRHLFTGNFGIEGFTQLPRWEGSRSIVLLARAPWADTQITTMAWVRCSLSGVCRDSSPVFAVNLDKPPYGPSPWVLADQRLR